MRRFVDDNGIFDILVPSNWKYFLIDDKVHTFQEHNASKLDTFQISIRAIDKKKSQNLLQIQQKISLSKFNGKEIYRYPEVIEGDLTTKIWKSLIDNKIIVFTLTHSTEPDKDLSPQSVKDKEDEIHKVILSFKLIPPIDREEVLNTYRFEMFLKGMGASEYMLTKAVDNKAFIEATCLIANQIDSLLRIGIILQKQINNNNKLIEKEWIYQGLGDKIKTEKEIYKKAKNLKIINNSTYEKLKEIYNDRNRVIHRFIISEITVAEVEAITYAYYEIRQEVRKTIYDIESNQIKLGVGMTKLGSSNNESIENFIKGKIGKINYFDQKKQ